MSGGIILEYLRSLGSWNWFIVAGILLALEIAAPGTFMLWLGLAALAVGVISLGVEWSWQAQVATFAVLSIAAIPVFRRIARKFDEPTDSPFLNRRAQELVGREFTIEKPIVNAVGTIRINDTVWRVNGPDSPAGSRVRITSANGAELQVERAPE